MWNHCKVEQVERAEQACIVAGVWSQWRRHLISLGQLREHIAIKSNLSRHLLNLKVLPTSKALKFYIALSSTSTTNCFALMFKRKLDRFMMKCDNRLGRFSEALIKWHSMSSIKKFMCSRKMTLHDLFKQYRRNPNFCQKVRALNRDAYLNGCVLKREIIVHGVHHYVCAFK